MNTTLHRPINRSEYSEQESLLRAVVLLVHQHGIRHISNRQVARNLGIPIWKINVWYPTVTHLWNESLLFCLAHLTNIVFRKNLIDLSLHNGLKSFFKSFLVYHHSYAPYTYFLSEYFQNLSEMSFSTCMRDQINHHLTPLIHYLDRFQIQAAAEKSLLIFHLFLKHTFLQKNKDCTNDILVSYSETAFDRDCWRAIQKIIGLDFC